MEILGCIEISREMFTNFDNWRRKWSSDWKKSKNTDPNWENTKTVRLVQIIIRNITRSIKNIIETQNSKTKIGNISIKWVIILIKLNNYMGYIDAFFQNMK